ncbi:MAG: alpha/beta hydrolase [Rhodospirillaceae bacterium]|nr:alpha/beta hydrolase [Rhodospirillaceae bacterium]
MPRDHATAGFRNAGWTMQHLPEGTALSVHPLSTLDGAATNGFLYRRGTPDTVLCIMHPREFLATHYLVPEILAGGHAVWTQTPRAVGTDLRLEHEIALLDVDAGMRFLREAGFRRVILLGNSGGSGLYGLYNEQSLLAPEKRLARTPGGRPTRLGEAALPPADGVILVSPHPGQGMILMNCIDPAVTDERDPLSRDPALDFLDRANGFGEPPRYAPDFVARYRAGQRGRVARIDAIARDLIAARQAARAEAKAGGTRDARARAAHTPVMTVWRTDADLRCWDATLDPSDRAPGSVWGKDPFASNYGAVGFARFCTPEAWLSTWSGLSSQANLMRTAGAIEQPCLQIDYTGDNTLFPADAAAIFAAIRTGAKQRLRFRGDHHGRALAPGEEPGRVAAGRAIRDWTAAHFPPA